MTDPNGPRRLPARANAEPRVERGYRDEIERQWDAAVARAQVQAAKDAEIQRRIDARKTGDDWLSTIEAAWDVLAERDAGAADARAAAVSAVPVPAAPVPVPPVPAVPDVPAVPASGTQPPRYRPERAMPIGLQAIGSLAADPVARIR